MYLLDCGPQRDGAGELLPSPALFAEAPDRRLAKGGGMREFTTRFSTACASVRMSFKEMAPFFFRALVPSAPVLDILGATSSGTPTTERCGAASNAIDGRGEAPSPLPSLSSWGRLPVRTTTTERYGVAS